MSLTFRGVALQSDEDPRAAQVYFDLSAGYSEPATVRGSDDVVPGLAGRYVRNRVADVRSIVLDGFVRGVGGTDVERTLAWRAATDTVMAAFELALDPGALVVGGGYLGITSSATISVRTVNVIGGPVISRQWQRWSVELEAVGSPPDWT